MSKEDDEMGQIEAINMLLNLIDPIYDAHSIFLKDVEMRLNNWDPPCIADILLQHFNYLEVYFISLISLLKLNKCIFMNILCSSCMIIIWMNTLMF
jgi:hypothetical protein